MMKFEERLSRIRELLEKWKPPPASRKAALQKTLASRGNEIDEAWERATSLFDEYARIVAMEFAGIPNILIQCECMRIICVLNERDSTQLSIEKFGRSIILKSSEIHSSLSAVYVINMDSISEPQIFEQRKTARGLFSLGLGARRKEAAIPDQNIESEISHRILVFVTNSIQLALALTSNPD